MLLGAAVVGGMLILGVVLVELKLTEAGFQVALTIHDHGRMSADILALSRTLLTSRTTIHRLCATKSRAYSTTSWLELERHQVESKATSHDQFYMPHDLPTVAVHRFHDYVPTHVHHVAVASSEWEEAYILTQRNLQCDLMLLGEGTNYSDEAILERCRKNMRGSGTCRSD
eukprot:747102-Hanusia_phi.AAC.2